MHTSSWFKSYLNGRTQQVKYNDEMSTPCNVSIGVPQGSVIGPILFILYVNDIMQYITEGCCNLFADDTLLYTTASTIDEVQTRLQKDVNSVEQRFNGNKLSANPRKSCTVLVDPTTRQRGDCNHPKLNISMYDQTIDPVHSFKYLGVFTNSDLKWHDHLIYLQIKTLAVN